MFAGVDYFFQQNSGIANSTKMAFIYSGIITFRYQLTSKKGIYARGEYFNDVDGCLTGRMNGSQNKPAGFVLTGETAGPECKVTGIIHIFDLKFVKYKWTKTKRYFIQME